MKIYRLHCDGCGSDKLERVGDFFVCKYCGSKQRIEEEKQSPIIKSTVKSDDEEKPTVVNKLNMNTEVLKNPVSTLVVRLILCIFLGTFGVHKFIERKYAMGIVYICTHGLFFVGCIIDVVRYIIEIVRTANGGGNAI